MEPIKEESHGVKNDKCKELLLEREDGETIKVLEFDRIIFPVQIFNDEEGIMKRLSYVKSLKYKPGDVLICSYPKTGSHWTLNLVHYLLYDGPLEECASHRLMLLEFFDVDEAYHIEGRRLLSSHLPPKYLPNDHFKNGGKTILVVRNPKDAVVSMYYMMQKQAMVGNFKMPWDLLLKYWLNGEMPYGSYFDYYNRWQEEFKTYPNMNVLVVNFEDLKRNGMLELRRIQNYLGVHHSDERLKAVFDKCSLNNLKADVDGGKVKSGLTDDKGKSVLFRKGEIGDWKNLFTVAQNEFFDVKVKERMAHSIFNYKDWN